MEVTLVIVERRYYHLIVVLTSAKLWFVAVGNKKVWLGQPYFCKLGIILKIKGFS